MKFLGTCAADGMPNPFCDCPICEDARKHPENRRFRSSFLLDERNLIDCGPDFNAQCAIEGLNLSNLENLFITHTHEDHFCTSNSGLLHMSRTRGEKPLDVYMSEEAYNATTMIVSALGEKLGYQDAVGDLNKGRVRIHAVKVGVPFEAGGYKVTAIPSTHNASDIEHAVNYIFEKDGQKLLYGCDTGYYLQDSLDLLKDAKLDILIMECTWGDNLTRPTSSHLNVEAFLIQLDNMAKVGAITEKTRIYATHINHKHNLTHPLLQKWFDVHSKFNVTVARDGMEI